MAVSIGITSSAPETPLRRSNQSISVSNRIASTWS